MALTARQPAGTLPTGTVRPAAVRPPRGPGLDRDLMVLASVVVLGSIMSILDTTIVNVALDTLGRDLHASLSSVQWVATGYLLSLSMVIPLTGWAIERFGAKQLWMVSTVLFLLGSMLCGASWSIGSLIVFRIVQGFGGGMIMPVGQTILAQAAGPTRMGRVMSIVGVPMMLGPVLGPVLGGILVQDASWRWIFYVNLPIGAVALFVAAKVLPSAGPRGGQRLDVRGLALLSPGLALLAYGLSEAASAGGFGGTRSVLGITIGLILVAGFGVNAVKRPGWALVDVRLLRRRSFSAGAGTSFLFGLSLFGAMILLPLYYQIVRGRGALETGLLLIPQGVASALSMPLAGRLTDSIGARKVVLGGLIATCAGTAGFVAVGANTPYIFLLGSLFVRGIGFGFTMMPAMAASYVDLESNEIPRGTTSLNIIQRVGGSIGTALMAVFLQREMVSGLRHLGGGVTDGGGSLSQLAALPPAAVSHVAPVIAHAFGRTFLLSLILTAVGLLPAAFLPRRSAATAPAPMGAGD